jgi:hypothetical protein
VYDHGTGTRPIARGVEPEHHVRMAWTTPSYDEIKMDAEIGSYQQDGDGENVPIAEPATATAAAE